MPMLEEETAPCNICEVLITNPRQIINPARGTTLAIKRGLDEQGRKLYDKRHTLCSNEAHRVSKEEGIPFGAAINVRRRLLNLPPLPVGQKEKHLKNKKGAKKTLKGKRQNNGPGFIYALLAVNHSAPFRVKPGGTGKDIESRIKDLSRPMYIYELFVGRWVSYDWRGAETLLHEILRKELPGYIGPVEEFNATGDQLRLIAATIEYVAAIWENRKGKTK